MRSEGKILLYCLLFCVITGCVTYYFSRGSKRQDIAMIDAVRLFDAFNMKKELELKEKQKLETLSKQVDSVQNKLQMAKTSPSVDEATQLAQVVAVQKEKLRSEFDNSNREINEQVWKRLNPYLEDFGRAAGVHLIIGANGMGTVLYNDGFYDLTDKAIQFVNKRYEEGN